MQKKASHHLPEKLESMQVSHSIIPVWYKLPILRVVAVSLEITTTDMVNPYNVRSMATSHLGIATAPPAAVAHRPLARAGFGVPPLLPLHGASARKAQHIPGVPGLPAHRTIPT